MTNATASTSYQPLCWLAPAAPLLGELPAELAPHLLDTGSLTARVRELAGGAASVALLRHEHRLAELDEAGCLHIPAQQPALIRDIHLFGNGKQPWIFAHTVIPAGTLSGDGERLGRLGNKPLGEALFADPGIRRSNLQLAKLQPQHALYSLATVSCDSSPADIWGRRSQFHLSSGGSLLVAEFFLPAHPAVAGV